MLDSRLQEQYRGGGEEKMEQDVDTDEERKQRKQERYKIRKEERARRKQEEEGRERSQRRRLKAEARAKAKEEKRLFAIRKKEDAAGKMAAAQKLEEEARTMLAEINDSAKSARIAEGGTRGRGLAGKWSNASLDNQQQAISKKEGGEDGVVAAAGRGDCTPAFGPFPHQHIFPDLA